jgi:hypothetical protein
LTSTYPSSYVGVGGFQVLTDCSTPGCTAIEDCDPEEVNLNAATPFPYSGITTTGFYWLNLGMFVEDLLQPDQAEPFLSLLGLPSNCPVGIFGPPYTLMPVVQLTETQTITSSYQASKTSIAATPGLTITSTTPSPSASIGPYYLSANIIISSTIVQSFSSSLLPIETAPELPVISLGSLGTTPNSASTYAIGSKTLVAGSPTITVSGTTIPLAAPVSAIVIDASTQTLPVVVESQSIALSPELDLTIWSTIISPSAAGLYLVGTQTLAVGGPVITKAGTTISLGSSIIIINGQTQNLAPASNIPANRPTVTIGSSVITANPSGQYQIGTQTLTPGGPAITVSGTTISLATSATALIINGFTETIPPSPAPLPTSLPSPELPFVLGGTTLVADSAGAYNLGTYSLVPGGAAITISGTTLSLAPSDAAIIIDGQTYTADYEPVPSTASPAIATVDGQIVSLNSAGAYVIGSQTLTVGGAAITVDGTAVSLEPVGTGVDLVIGGSTEALTVAQPTSTLGLGEIIYSVFGALPTPSSTSNPIIHIGGASVCGVIDWWLSLILGMLAVFFVSPLW